MIVAYQWVMYAWQGRFSTIRWGGGWDNWDDWDRRFRRDGTCINFQSGDGWCWRVVGRVMSGRGDGCVGAGDGGVPGSLGTGATDGTGVCGGVACATACSGSFGTLATLGTGGSGGGVPLEAAGCGRQ